MDHSYAAVIARREAALRPEGPDGVAWWLRERTEPCRLGESGRALALYDDYLEAVFTELGRPLGRYLWSKVMTEHGHPSAPMRRGDNVFRVRKGVRLRSA